MTEHTDYSTIDAVPVGLQAALWPEARAKAAAEAAVPLVLERESSWSFRTVRSLAREGLVEPDAILQMVRASDTPARLHPAPEGKAVGFAAQGLDQFAVRLKGPEPEKPGAPRGRVNVVDIYSRHFGLTNRPFALTPDTGFLFWSEAHQHAYTTMEYGILTKSPITLVTGDIGAGKTTLVQHLIERITETGDLRIGLISNAQTSRCEMLRWVMMSLGQFTDPQATDPELVDAFNAYLIDEYAQGRRTVLIFDEAQNLGAEALEELRLLTNINTNKDVLLQLVLVGQPELRNLVDRDESLPFAQRIATSFHLGGMDLVTTRDYIAHRLTVAGARQNLFSDAAIQLIYEATGGIPRRINQLCDLAMVYAFTSNLRSVVRFTVQQVLNDGTFFGAAAPAMTDHFSGAVH